MRFLRSERALAKLKWDIKPLSDSQIKNQLALTVENMPLASLNFEVANYETCNQNCAISNILQFANSAKFIQKKRIRVYF